MIDGSGPTHWSASYTQSLTRMMERSARVLDLNYLVLHEMARGEVSLDALRIAGAQSLTTHGPSYVARVTERHAQFFAGMLRAATGVEDRPPTYDATDPAGWFRRLIVYVAEGHGRQVRALSGAAESAAAGTTSPADAVQALGSEAATPSMDALGPLVADLLSGLAEAGAAFEEEYLREVLTSRSASREGLRLRASLGDVASVSLSLENTGDERTTFRCLVTDVRRADGIGPAFMPAIAVDPDGLVLEPHQEGQVRLALALEAEAYAPDALYVGAVRVLGHDEGSLDVPLTILATNPPNSPSERLR